MTFQVGDTVIHPHYGAGVITEIQERHSLGPSKQYYSIELLGDSQTTVMVALQAVGAAVMRARCRFSSNLLRFPGRGFWPTEIFPVSVESSTISTCWASL